MSMAARTAKVWTRIATQPRLSPLETSSLPLRVLPGDLDMNLHLTNSRYLLLMDLGRLDLFGRLGFIGPAVKRRWRPMVGAMNLRFRRGLEPMQRFELRTRIVAWDAKWLYLEQAFVRSGQAATVAMLRKLWRGPEGNVPPSALWEAVGQGGVVSPELPAEFASWVESLSVGREEARVTH